MSHGSARLTVHGRLLIVQRHQAGWPQAHIAAAMGVSRKCVKTWIDRYAAEGEAGLRDRSSRPHSMPDPDQRRRSSARSSAAPRRASRRPRLCSAPRSGCRPGRCHGSCAATACPICASCDPITGRGDPVLERRPRSATNATGPASWCTWTSRSSAGSPTAAAGGPTAAQMAQTATAATAKSATTTSTPWSMTTPGWPTPRSCPTRRAPPARRSCTAPSDYFAAHGITRIERLMTDNAWAYRYSLRERLCRARHRADVHQAPLPLAERQGRTAQPHPATEWAYRQAFTSNDERTAALAPWLEHYNTQRRHSALGGLPPISRLLPT